MDKVLSKDVLAKILKGEPVECDSVYIDGDLDITKLDIQKRDEKFRVKSIIKITNSQIAGAINFADTEFKNDFHRDINFTGTTISGKVDFSRVHFCEGVNFQKVHFADDVDFEISKFDSAVFTDARLDGYSNFRNAKFRNNAIFDGIEFNNYANFVEARFKPIASFHWAVFNDVANFSKAIFCERANFDRARFIIDANFANANFNKDIILKDAIFTRIDISWESIKNRLEYNDAIYLGLAKNYNNIGLFSDADNCYYQYRTLRRKNHLKGFEYFLDLIAWIPFGYGTRFYYPLILMIGLFFVFAGLFLCGKQVNSVIDALDLSVVILTTTTQIGNLTGPCRFWSIVERITGWLLMASFLVVLARKTIR